jgi:alkylation response protein AidB-like acyl-CoA dehydrogenase
MDFDFSDEQYELRDEARRFLDKQCPMSNVRETLDDPAAWSRDLWKQMADLGWMALAFPEEYGGLGRSPLDLALLLGELGRALAPVPFLTSVAIGGQLVLYHGSPEQKAALAPAIASGDRIVIPAIGEANGTWGRGGETIATKRGDDWTLTGVKEPVWDAPAADAFLVSAESDGEVYWFLVEEPARVEARTTYDRTRSAGTLVLDDTPAERYPVPRPPLGFPHVAAPLCAEMLGVAQKILDMSVEYAKVREQFGRPIGSFQAIKHKLAEMATELEAARAAGFYAAWATAEGADDMVIASSIAKSYCSDALAHLAGEGVQVHGGIAFTWEHDMQLYLKRIKSSQAMFGDASFHREIVAQLAGL